MARPEPAGLSDAAPGRIVLVGCGRMGQALLSGWLDRGLPPERVIAVEPDAANAAMVGAKGVTVVADAAEVARAFADAAPDLLLIAVKPQTLPQVIGGYAAMTAAGCPILSIAAGKTIGFFTRALGATTAVVRAMPNTPAAIGKGITVCVANQAVTEARRALCGQLLEAVGEVAWIADEAQMDAVTAVSGSGPAYAFLLAEVMAQAGIRLGLMPELSARLARVTVSGAGALMEASDEDLATLRRNVTSPGGVTAAVLEVLMGEGGMPGLFREALAAGVRRSRELAE